jgi:sigma-B regulation protein RsbU (phosphoserine phosphatase)
MDRPGRLLGQLNEELCETSTRGMFVTMVAGTFDPKRGIVCLANAGHEPPLCRSAAGEFTAVPAEAPPLGIASGIVKDGIFPGAELRLGGGSLYVFSDGLTEACSHEGGLLGAEGVKELISASAHHPVAERVQEIVTRVGQLELRDDLTLLAVSSESEP